VALAPALAGYSADNGPVKRACQGDARRRQELVTGMRGVGDRDTGPLWARANRPRHLRRADGAQAPIAPGWLMSSDAANGGARSAGSLDTATAARIARIASGSSTVASKQAVVREKALATQTRVGARAARDSKHGSNHAGACRAIVSAPSTVRSSAVPLGNDGGPTPQDHPRAAGSARRRAFVTGAPPGRSSPRWVRSNTGPPRGPAER
jgi:hypothetical protein